MDTISGSHRELELVPTGYSQYRLCNREKETNARRSRLKDFEPSALETFSKGYSMESSEVMTVREAMALLHCKRSFIFKLIHSGRISYAPVGGHFVVKRKEIENVLERSWRRNGVVEVSQSAARN